MKEIEIFKQVLEEMAMVDNEISGLEERMKDLKDKRTQLDGKRKVLNAYLMKNHSFLVGDILEHIIKEQNWNVEDVAVRVGSLQVLNSEDFTSNHNLIKLDVIEQLEEMDKSQQKAVLKIKNKATKEKYEIIFNYNFGEATFADGSKFYQNMELSTDDYNDTSISVAQRAVPYMIIKLPFEVVASDSIFGRACQSIIEERENDQKQKAGVERK